MNVGEQIGNRIDRLHITGVAARGLDPRADALMARYQTHFAQAAQGFAHGVPRYAELLAQLGFGRQKRADRVAPGSDILDDRVGKQCIARGGAGQREKLARRRACFVKWRGVAASGHVAGLQATGCCAWPNNCQSATSTHANLYDCPDKV